MSREMFLEASIQPMKAVPALTVPPDKFDIYLRYKKGTREIIAWLLKHGSRRYKNVESVTIRDLIQIVQAMHVQSITMPDTIHFLFRETIAARSHLSRFFRARRNTDREDQDTANHEFFTTSLSKIYDDLCECCNRPPNECRKVAGHSLSQPKQKSMPNRYAVLAQEKDHGHSLAYEAATDCQECTQSASICTGGKVVPRLADDGLGDLFELSTEFKELEQLLLAIGSIWEQVQENCIPLAVAAFTTNAALSMYEEVESRIHTICGSTDPENIKSRLSQFFGNTQQATGVESPNTFPSEEPTLLHPWTTLLQVKADYVSGRLCPVPPVVCDPTRLLISQDHDSSSTNHDHMDVLLQSVAYYIAKTPHPNAVVRLGTPLFADIGYFLTHDAALSHHGLRCIYGLHIFQESYKKYVSAARKCETMNGNCRLQALKFAQEALPGLSEVLNDQSMPCRCYRTLAFHLDSLQSQLKDFLEERNFGLFFQSPWICGAHILEMLDTTFYYGLRLLSYRNYVGSVLHAYNILRLFGGLHEVPLLEELCNTFNEVIFPGGRPIRNFKACWIRFIGGRLRFNSHDAKHRSGNHHFVIPPYKAEATAGFGLRTEPNDARFAYRRISFCYHIKERGYHLDENLWAEVYGDEGKSRKSCSVPRHHGSAYASCGSQHRLLHLHSKALSEFSSNPLPAVKVNIFTVYMHCVRIIAIITNKMHEKTDERCTCFLETLVFAADRFQEQGRKNEPFGYKSLIQTCNDAISVVLAGKSCEQFLWTAI